MKILRYIGSTLYKWWMAFARALAVVNTTLILSIVYLLLIGPSWLVMKILRKDLLDRKADAAVSFWRTKEATKHTMEQSKHQF